MNNDSEFYAHVEYDATNIFLHEEFYPGNLYNDIAIIRLNGYVDYARKYGVLISGAGDVEKSDQIPTFAVPTSTRSACPTGSRTSTGGAAS